MLSYLHAFHAGNHADILKHAALIQILKRLNQKEAPYTFFDTHAGSGLYSLQGGRAKKTGEAQKGILALDAYCRSLECKMDESGAFGAAADSGAETEAGENQKILVKTKMDARPKSAAIPAAISDYLSFIRPYERLDLYPGSPLIERGFLRKGDAHTICELHPKEFVELKENCARAPLFDGRAESVLNGGDFSKGGRQGRGNAFCKTNVLNEDGFKTLAALAPPKTNRGAALIDPSYEKKSDYEAVQETAAAVRKKWMGGTIAIWFPLLAHRAAEIERMISFVTEAAKAQNPNTEILRAQFLADSARSHTETALSENAAQNKDAPRLYGSGLLVLNPPWKLDQTLEAALAFLEKVPGLAKAPSHSVEKI